MAFFFFFFQLIFYWILRKVDLQLPPQRRRERNIKYKYKIVGRWDWVGGELPRPWAGAECVFLGAHVPAREQLE